MTRAAWWLAVALLAVALPGPAPRPGPCPSREGAARLLCGLRLDLNRAPVEDLEVLPGIGPSRARALAQARPFGSLAEVTRVHGVGPVSVERMRPFVEVLP